MLADRPLNISIRKPKQDPAFVFQSVFTRKINELAQQSADMLDEEVRRQITSKGLVATGNLLRSVTTNIEDARSGKLISVSSNLIQARVSETGSRPQRGGARFGSRWDAGTPTHKKNSPFMANIMVWMAKKGIGGGKSAAFRIARAIALKGIPSNSAAYPLRRPFTNAQRNVRRRMQELWRVELDRAIARLNRSNA